MDKIILTGPFDRHNYGDLLFPVLLTAYIEKHVGNDVPIEYYGSIDSDLTKYDGIKTKSSNKLFLTKVTENSLVVIVGGAVLASTWINILSYLKSNNFYSFIIFLNKILPSEFLEFMLRKRFNLKLKKPFIIPKGLFKPVAPKIVYNSVGGSGLLNINSSAKQYIANELNNSDYISVRDEKSYANAKKIGVTKTIEKSPDSALIMSDFFSIEKLKKIVDKTTLDIIEKFGENYFCFQIGEKFAAGHYDLIAKGLDEISHKYNIPILLLPIGNAPGHNNDIALNKISDKMKSGKKEILKSHGIFDIMLGIAASQIFAGTSLHGNITATSFNIQTIVLTTKVKKLNDYICTWYEKGSINIVELEDLPQVFDELKTKNFTGYKNMESLKNAVYRNYEKLFSV